MGLKTMLQKWLGITPDKPKQSAARVYQAPIQTMYEPTLQRLQFEKTAQKTKSVRSKHHRDWSHKTMKRTLHAPKTAREMYDACGGYDAFRIIAMHPSWYKIEKNKCGPYSHALRVLNRSSLSRKNIPESKIMRVISENHGEEIAMQLMEIHITEISKRKNH
jgi:hypothetical protein